VLIKEKLLHCIQAMPEEKFEDNDVVLERIVILEKIEKGELDIAEGKVFTTEEAKEKLGKT
jgi:predicted transcriptional regulator